MTSICLHFHVHQPQWLRHYSFFDIDHDHRYEDRERNLTILNALSEKCYLPANKMILDVITRHEGKFRIALSITGVLLEQFENHRVDVLDSFMRLADTGCVEFIGETYYHSLAFLFSLREFREQSILHKKKITMLFGQTPRTFRHTEFIYHNDLANIVEKMGYHSILAGSVEGVLGWRSPNYVYQPAGCKKIKLLMRNRRLSDEIAVRFSDVQGSEYPLLADNYADRIHTMGDAGDVINLFVEYGIFSEREPEERGIFDFIRSLPGEILKHPDFTFRTPAEIAKNLDPVAQLDVRDDIASSGAENNLQDWTGNSLQKDAITSLYSMEAKLRRRKDGGLLHTWRLLQEAEIFHCMHTGKRAEDGGMGTFSNPYSSPYDAYINYMNIIDDFSGMLGKRRSSTYEGA